MPAEFRDVQGREFFPKWVVCITLIPPYAQAQYSIDERWEARASTLVNQLGPNCRVSKHQWSVVTDEPCGGISQDLCHEGAENVLVFAMFVGHDWRFCCKPESKTDEWEFDGIAAFLQQKLERDPDAGETT